MKKNKTGWGKKVKGGIFKLDLWADEVTVHVNILQEHSSSGKKKNTTPPKKTVYHQVKGVSRTSMFQPAETQFTQIASETCTNITS